jgi:hypothetical protein
MSDNLRDMFIRVRIDYDEVYDGSRVLQLGPSYDGSYTVILSPREIKQMGTKPYAALAHELGHVLGLEFQFPAHQEIVQIQNKQNAYITATDNGAMLRREDEAWDVAEEMFRLREKGIESYKQVWTIIRMAKTLKRWATAMKWLFGGRI